MEAHKRALDEYGQVEINKPLLSNLKHDCSKWENEKFNNLMNNTNNQQQYGGCFDNGKLLEKNRLYIDNNNFNCDCTERKLMKSNDKRIINLSTVEKTTGCLSYWFQFNSSTPVTYQNKNKQSKEFYYNNNSFTMNKLIKITGIILIVMLCVVCIYETWNLKKGNSYKTRIKMVNIFSRHGDRSPADGFQYNDLHRNKIKDYWPNGLSNLTEIGKYRQFRVGLKLRELYRDYLGFNSSEILALSSPVYRCYQSLQETLRGLYNVEFSRYFNLKALNKYKDNCLRFEQSSKLANNIDRKVCKLTTSEKKWAIANEWKNININTTIVPTLTWQYLNNCPWKLKNPFLIDEDALLSPNIAKLKGIKKLERTLIDNYHHKNLNYSMTHVWSTILAELNAFHTQTTYNDTKHFINWINEPANDNHHDSKNEYEYNDDDEDDNDDDEDEEEEHDDEITLYDLLEEATIQIYNDRIKGRAALIQNGPILTSLIDSHLVAMKQFNSVYNKNSINYYKDKKLILYSTHDSIIINLLSALDLIDFGNKEIFMQNQEYESRFRKYNNDKSDVVKLLNGIRMPAFGSSIRFELVELESSSYYNEEDNNSKELFYYVRLFIYNKEDAKYGDIEYEKIKLGTMCQRRYIQLYPHSNRIHTFYNSRFQFDKRFGCPFELFRNLTSHFLIGPEKLNQACNDF